MQLKQFKPQYALLVLQLVALLAWLGFLISGNFSTNLFSICYTIILVFSLPLLISKVIWKRSALGISTVVNFMTYPLLALLIIAASHLLGETDLEKFRYAIGILIVICWNILFAIFVLRSQFKFQKKHLLVLLPILLLLLVNGVFIRAPGSILALDYLQHQTVAKEMAAGTMCVLPGQCSNLFLQQGYTTIYHSILLQLTSIFSFDLTSVIYAIDMIFPLFILAALYRLFTVIFKRPEYAVFGSLFSIFVFINGSYEQVFWLPQTLAFYLFLNIVVEQTKSAKLLIVGLIILLLTHFVMGSYLAIFVVTWYITFHTEFLEDKNFRRSVFFILATCLILVAILNYNGFSFEREFQPKDIATVGGDTNLYQPANYIFLLSILNVNTLFLVLSLISYIFRKQKDKWLIWAVISLLLNLIIYFLGPTYANKFLMGLGVYSGIIITAWLASKRIPRLEKYIFASLILLTAIINFGTQYFDYEKFYGQDSGAYSAFVQEDKPIIDYLNNHQLNCLVISDPYTQIIIAGYTGLPTASAQYMVPDSRKAIQAFDKSPSSQTYKSLTSITELKSYDGELCFLYTSRLQESTVLNYDTWTGNIYSYIIDNNYPIKSSPAAVNYLLNNQKGKLMFKNANFYLIAGLKK